MLRIRSHSSSSASSTGGERRATAYVVLLRWLHVLLCVRTSGRCRCEHIFATLPGRLALSLPQNVCAFSFHLHCFDSFKVCLCPTYAGVFYCFCFITPNGSKLTCHLEVNAKCVDTLTLNAWLSVWRLLIWSLIDCHWFCPISPRIRRHSTFRDRLMRSCLDGCMFCCVFAHLVAVAAKTFLQRCQVALLCLYLRTCALSLFTCIALTASRSVFAQNTQLSFIVSVL